MNGYWKGVLFSLLGAVVLPLLLAMQLQLGERTIDLTPLAWMAGSLFCTFLIGWLAGLVHMPSGDLVGMAPAANLGSPRGPVGPAAPTLAAPPAPPADDAHVAPGATLFSDPAQTAPAVPPALP